MASAIDRAQIMGFEHQTAEVNGINVHYVIGGSGAPLLLWHGFCETWYCWRKIMPELAKRFTVIAPDMRGFGDSGKPEGKYDARLLATDLYQLVQQLGFEKLGIVAHDMGAPAALMFAAEHPEMVQGLVYLEEPVLTKATMADIHAFTPEAVQNGLLWWWRFAFAYDLPETLLAGKEQEFLAWFHQHGTFDPGAVEKEAAREYLRTFASTEGIRGAFGVYRGIFDTIEQTETLTGEHKITVPVLGLGGAKGKGDQVAHQLRQVARHVSGGTVENCGHFVADEQPEVLIKHVLSFFDDVS
ncbi:MAG TPA: alpha/beta hydrolase [Candidatus Saccharimonadales bacterium]|nr:alpha/beta hydrolase [Candidatus Saccharimonadales bacterium]